jgi:hypothetical protein
MQIILDAINRLDQALDEAAKRQAAREIGSAIGSAIGGSTGLMALERTETEIDAMTLQEIETWANFVRAQIV